ncbi:MAG: hypothetical protein KDL87_19330, partial [Verrucomicrobiae bacterium]|nr:hypothetical protein [Verrucomicrobiae bacterium]
ILGLADEYDADSDGDLMHGGVVEGVRRLPEVGAADGAVAGSQTQRAAATLSVTTFNDIVNSGDGDLSLREAINDAVDGDIISLGAGTYLIELDDGADITTTPSSDNGTNENANASGDFDINGKILTIQGAGKDVTFIDAQELDRVFHIYGGANVTLKDLTITGGHINYSHGGGILIDGSTTAAHLENVKIDGNTVQTEDATNNDRHGGGMWVQNATVTGVNVDITNNTATRNGAGRNSSGAGLWASSAANVTLTDSNISNNTATHSAGGGVYA